MNSDYSQPLMLPFPTRKAGIAEKLAYAESQRTLLDQALWDSYKEEGSLPRFVSQTAESILSNARECFDHLGRDLIECHLVPVAKPSFRIAYIGGKIRQYFPFYPGQLSNPQAAFHQFKTANRSIYDELRFLVDAMDNNLSLLNTSHAVRKFRIIQEMVNEKKHSRVLAYDSVANERMFVQGSSGSCLFDKDFRNDHPNIQILLPRGFSSKRVAAYRFSCNGMDVSDLCLFASHATAMLMDLFYDKFFSATAPVFQPEPPPTITVSDSPPVDEFETDRIKNIIDLP